MKTKAIFYHAGCTVCVSAEQAFAGSLDPARFDVEVVNFAESPARIGEAEAAGVVSVPAFVIHGTPFHINFGASMADVKGS
ncbi:thioredoxin [Aquidulcibacter sp.]|uniref:thioredoxin n=1 Tax=Aquidulcibacter sp. TaxID=2052990 RepID=UPI0025B9EC40|nr:thioredoxin [Aquidulcibacter sp.]MCA3696030.1 thioredoxin family protein [Aquidulcibacter sp.]